MVKSLARLAWYPVAILAIGILVLAMGGYLALLPEGPHAARFNVALTPLNLAFNVLFVLLSVAVSILSISLAWLLFRKSKSEPIALFVSYFLLAHGVLSAGALENLEYLIPGAYQFSIYVLQPMLMLPMSYILFATFPDGRFIPTWTRWVVIASFVVGPITAVLANPNSPFQGPADLIFAAVLWLLLSASMIYAQVHRYRMESSLAQRQQTKWFVYGLFLWLSLTAVSSIGWFTLEALPSGSQLPWWVPLDTLVWVLSVAVLPVTLTIAVLRFRLYNIDLIINRTLVYGGLSAVIVLLYVFIVGSLSALFQTSGSLVISLIGTGLVAISVNPLRAQLQTWVDRRLYGHRDNPAAVLDQLHKGFEAVSDPGQLLATATQVITESLKLPYASFDLSVSGREVTSSAGQETERVLRYPLYYRGEEMGDLQVGPRAPDEPLSEAEEYLLRQVASQTGAAVRAMFLAEDLQRVRTGLVTTREEERRRLRRDLHDSLGPVLASQGLKMAAVRELMEENPTRARDLLEQVVAQNEKTVTEIRRLVYGLRPPALDELGLVGAVLDFTEEVKGSSEGSISLSVQVHSPEGGLPPLPAAIEVAAFRITMEALANVVRHAEASECEITLNIIGSNDAQKLSVVIKDNGRGLPKSRTAGVGLISMRERAEEVGGHLKIESDPSKGTLIQAHLPLLMEK